MLISLLWPQLSNQLVPLGKIGLVWTRFCGNVFFHVVGFESVGGGFIRPLPYLCLLAASYILIQLAIFWEAGLKFSFVTFFCLGADGGVEFDIRLSLLFTNLLSCHDKFWVLEVLIVISTWPKGLPGIHSSITWFWRRSKIEIGFIYHLFINRLKWILRRSKREANMGCLRVALQHLHLSLHLH